MLETRTQINVEEHAIGVTVARFQVEDLHEGQIKMLDTVCKNHGKVIIFLGIPNGDGGKHDPLDYATREVMIKTLYPNVIVLPQKDNRSDEVWSKNLDASIKLPFGDLPALLYGSRDSFIPHYKGQYKTVELLTDVVYSGTQARKKVSTRILPTSDFRAGVIHSVYAQRPVTYPTVDVVAYNEKNQILLAKKPNEDKYRFIGGFVDRTDMTWEQAARREFMEEANGCEIGDLKYVASGAINDWRYAKSENGIMTTLFLGEFMWGQVKPTDDIAELAWIDPNKIDYEKDIMQEHQHLFVQLLVYLNQNNIIKIALVEKANKDVDKFMS
jgi:bifunctional NMN adenylyltransferase/nudix hydrolase